RERRSGLGPASLSRCGTPPASAGGARGQGSVEPGVDLTFSFVYRSNPRSAAAAFNGRSPRGSKEKAVMAEITAQMVKELRERTGAGMMDCKNALNDCKGDMESAVDALRKKGLAAAAKKAGRITAEGAVGSYIHGGGKIG